MSPSGSVWDNATTESFFSSLKAGRIRRKVYRMLDAAMVDVLDYIECSYNMFRGLDDRLFPPS